MNYTELVKAVKIIRTTVRALEVLREVVNEERLLPIEKLIAANIHQLEKSLGKPTGTLAEVIFDEDIDFHSIL